MTLFITAALAAETLTLDLDGDGLLETIEAHFDDDAHLQIAITEQDRRRTLDLGTIDDFEGSRTNAVILKAIPKEETGVAMVQFLVPAGEYCGSGDSWFYVSYFKDEPRLALQISNFSDAPVWSRMETAFNPKRRTVWVTKTTGDGDEIETTTKQKLAFVKGVYRE